MIDFNEFNKIDIRTGTILEAELNSEAHTPAYVMRIDFGELGEKISSAQLTENYEAGELKGMQIVAVVNFPPKRIAGIKSEVLVLGALDNEQGTVLLQTERKISNGMKIA